MSARPWPPALAGPEYDIVDGDDRRRVTNTRVAPFRYVCKLEMDFLDPITGQPQPFIGSGMLVGPNKVLTAAHCIFDRHGGAGYAQRVRVIPGKNGPGQNTTTEPFGAAFALSLDVPNAWKITVDDRAAMAFDYGVITLDVPLGSQVGWLQSVSAPSDAFLFGNQMHTAGYPGDQGGDHQYRVFNRPVRLFPQRFEYLHDVMGGQSGSAMWVRWEETRTIVGIVTTHDDPLTAVRANTGVRITAAILADLRRWGVAPTPGLDRPTLRRGARGPMVMNLQARLNVWLTTPPRSGPTLAVDGIFGALTEGAVHAFQRERGLLVDGIVGPQTWGALLATAEAEVAALEAEATARAGRPAGVTLSAAERTQLRGLIGRAGLDRAPRSGGRAALGALRQRRQIIRQFLRQRRAGGAGPSGQARSAAATARPRALVRA